MGVAYKPNNNVDCWLSNYAGQDMITQLHKRVEAHVPMSMTKQEAEESARLIEKAEDDIFEELAVSPLWRGSKQEFQQWAFSWSKWLKKSGGFIIE